MRGDCIEGGDIFSHRPYETKNRVQISLISHVIYVGNLEIEYYFFIFFLTILKYVT